MTMLMMVGSLIKFIRVAPERVMVSSLELAGCCTANAVFMQKRKSRNRLATANCDVLREALEGVWPLFSGVLLGCHNLMMNALILCE